MAPHFPAYWTAVETRVQVSETRFRVPDVMALRGGMPRGSKVVEPPALVVEVVSPDDRIEELNQKIADYRAFGIPHIWVIFPRTRQAHVYSKQGIREVGDTLEAGELRVPLAAILP